MLTGEKCRLAVSKVTGIPEGSLIIQEDYGKDGAAIQDESSNEYYVEPTNQIKDYTPAQLQSIEILGEHEGRTVYKEKIS
ncbi:hypothetical protein GZH47_33440 (plasmid) [Paenibacillus rhizovicinus]|uniref:Uncharacterized protein n=1 Tax=Paenibacillus rhizovicinus TaxID=2704463 RepID=A0A6C0PBH9_9BACL|nr:hypothetical protein [Paenibacillus rhizovicinus]QHW35799.1 hypothetical protein GZH47_33440 [Paenibacillus rhizovicinus]